MKNAFVCALIALCAVSVRADRLELVLEPGEGWWGGATTFGSQAPYGLRARSLEFDLRVKNYENQAAPLLLSTHGRWVWCDKGFAAKLADGALTVASDDGVPIASGRAGASLRSAYAHASASFFPPSGRTPDLLFVSAPQYNTWIELQYNQNEKDILDYARKIVDNGLPPGVLMIDDTWQTGYGVWEFDARRFSNPRAMTDRLHAMGFRIMFWMVPYVSMDTPPYRTLAREGGLLLEAKDDPVPVSWWNGKSAVLDLVGEKGQRWFHRQLRRLEDEFGVDGFKFDAGDIYAYDLELQSRGNYDRSLGQALGVEQTEAYAKIGLEHPFNEYRACWKMGGQPLVQRLCDKAHDWASLQRLVPDMIAAGLLGHQFVCPDMIGGGSYTSLRPGAKVDEELFVRSAQTHALSSMMQFSAAPWRVLSSANFAIVKDAVALRMKYAPRYVELAKSCARTGEPMLRSMDWQFPGQGFESVTDQFVMGDFLIVAPQLEKGASTRVVRLPAGCWKADDGTVTKGPAEVTVSTPLSRIPHFERADALP